MNFEVIDGAAFTRDPGGAPSRTPKQIALIVSAAEGGKRLKDAAADIQPIYYGDDAKSEGVEYDAQIAYLSKLISLRRRGSFPMDALTGPR